MLGFYKLGVAFICVLLFLCFVFGFFGLRFVARSKGIMVRIRVKLTARTRIRPARNSTAHGSVAEPESWITYLMMLYHALKCLNVVLRALFF